MFKYAPIGPRPYMPGKTDALKRRIETIVEHLRARSGEGVEKGHAIAAYPLKTNPDRSTYSFIFCTYADDRSATRDGARDASKKGAAQETVRRSGVGVLLCHTAPLAALIGAEVTFRDGSEESASWGYGGTLAEQVERFLEPAPPPSGWDPLVRRIRAVLAPFVHTLDRDTAMAPLPFIAKHSYRRSEELTVVDAVFPDQD